MNKKMLAIGMFFTVSLCMHAMDDQQRSNAQIREAYLAAQQRRAVQAGVGSAADAVDELARVEVEPHVESLELRSESPGCVSGHDDVLGEHQDIKRQLIKAAQHNDLDRFLKLQEHSEQLPEGWTPLRAACYGGSLRIVQYLVEHHNAKFDVADLLPLRCAAAHNHVDIIRYAQSVQLLPDTIKNDCMRVACEHGNLETIQCLIEECGVARRALIKSVCGFKRMMPLDVACESGHLPVVQYLLEGEIQEDLAFRLRACKPEDIRLSAAEVEAEVARNILNERTAHRTVETSRCTKCNAWVCGYYPVCMLNHSAHIERNVERRLPSPLHYACFAGRHEVARYLIERGAPVENVCDLRDSSVGMSVLHCAYLSGNIELARFIREALETKAVLSEKKPGFFRRILQKIKRREVQSAPRVNDGLHIVAQEGTFPMLEYVLAHAPEDALIHSLNHKGRTVLMCAIHGGNRAMVNGLILRQLKLMVPSDEEGQQIYRETAYMFDVQLNEGMANLAGSLDREFRLGASLMRNLNRRMDRWDVAPGIRLNIDAHLSDGTPLPEGLDEQLRAQINHIDKHRQNLPEKLKRITQMQQFIAMRRASITASVLNVLRNKVIKELGGSVSLLAIQEDIHAGRWSDEAPSPLLVLPPEILCRIASLAYDYNGPLWPKPSKLKAGSHTDMNG